RSAAADISRTTARVGGAAPPAPPLQSGSPAAPAAHSPPAPPRNTAPPSPAAPRPGPSSATHRPPAAQSTPDLDPLPPPPASTQLPGAESPSRAAVPPTLASPSRSRA